MADASVANASVPLTTLLLVGLKSVASVAGCAGVGAYARHTGLLDDGIDKGLDKLISSLFMPCLIMHKVIPTMSLEALVSIWPLALMCVCQVLYGLGSGRLLACSLERRYQGAFPRFTGLCMVAVAFPNSFSVPLALLLALGDHPVLLADGQEGGQALRAQITAQLLMSYSLWILARWSIGYPILSGSPSFKEWRKKALNAPVIACVGSIALGLASNAAPPRIQAAWQPGGALQDVVDVLATPIDYAGRCSVPATLMTLGSKLYSAIVEIHSKGCFPVAGSDLEADHVPDGSESVRDGNKLGLRSESTSHDGDQGSMPLVAYAGLLLLRQVGGGAIGAALGIGLLRGLCSVEDPVVLMVGMMQSAGPPMINLAVMAGLSSTAEIETAKLLLLTYSVSIVSWTLWVAVFLNLLQATGSV